MTSKARFNKDVFYELDARQRRRAIVLVRYLAEGEMLFDEGSPCMTLEDAELLLALGFHVDSGRVRGEPRYFTFPRVSVYSDLTDETLAAENQRVLEGMRATVRQGRWGVSKGGSKQHYLIGGQAVCGQRVGEWLRAEASGNLPKCVNCERIVSWWLSEDSGRSAGG